MSSKNKFFKMLAYLKVVDKLPNDYTFCNFGDLSNRLPRLVAGFQQPAPKTSVSLESFYASFQVKMGQKDLIYLSESLQTVSIK